MSRTFALVSGEGLVLYCNRLDAITGLEREIVGRGSRRAGGFATGAPELTHETNLSFSKTLIHPQDLPHSFSKC